MHRRSAYPKPPGAVAQGGVTLVLFAAATLSLLAMAGLALDLGVAYLQKTRVQNAADAAALAGAKALILLNSTAQASAAAQATFALNGVDLRGAPAPTVEFSPTLTPFAPGGLNPRFVRVSVSAIPVNAFFARAIPGVGETFNVGGAAVAGPEPLGGTVCRALPVAICGTPGDSDCSDGTCFGLAGDPLTRELQVKGDNSSLGPGNYGLVRLGCSGADCTRRGMAGSEAFCFNPNGLVTTEPGISAGPTAQGANTRFGLYRGPVSQADYPPDVVTDNLPFPLATLNYAAYRARLANPATWNYPEAVGVPQRRVVPVPVVDCSVPINGTTSAQVLGTACMFLTREVEAGGPDAGTLYAELVGTCLTSGGTVQNPPADSAAVRITLYQNPAGA